MTTQYQRDVRGRFARVDTSNTALSADSKFDVMRELEIRSASADDVRPGMEVKDHAPRADDVAQDGQWSPLRARNPTLVHPDEYSEDPREARNMVLRSAARDSGQMDPTYELVSGFGAESPGTRSATGRNTDG